MGEESRRHSCSSSIQGRQVHNKYMYTQEEKERTRSSLQRTSLAYEIPPCPVLPHPDSLVPEPLARSIACAPSMHQRFAVDRAAGAGQHGPVPDPGCLQSWRHLSLSPAERSRRERADPAPLWTWAFLLLLLMPLRLPGTVSPWHRETAASGAAQGN